ncbi:MAG TPA: amidohydrolase family protein [Acidimicrobiales bacterium]
MALDALPVIDADGHIVEPDATFRDHLDPRYVDYAPRVIQYRDHFRYACGDRLGFPIYASPVTVGAPGQTAKVTDEPVLARGASDPAGRLADLDVDGIAQVVLYPTYGLMIQGVVERDAAIALCRAINDWLAEYCSHDPRRLIGVGTLPMTDGEAALAEARRCVEQLGFRGVWRRPERFPGVAPLHDPGHDALYSYLEEAGVPLAIHPGMNGVVPYEYFGDRFDRDFSAMHAAHFPVEQMMSLTSLVAFGILERHPRLRVALLECGAGWLPYYAHRLDEHLEVFGFDRASLSMRPSDYIRRQCVVSVEEVEPGLPAVLEQFPDCVVFASDYPHADGVFPGATKPILAATELDDASKRRVLVDNARRLYGLSDNPDTRSKT